MICVPLHSAPNESSVVVLVAVVVVLVVVVAVAGTGPPGAEVGGLTPCMT